MNRMLFGNNFGTVGKWVESNFLFGIFVAVFMFIPIISYAYISDTVPTSSYQPAELKLDFNQIGKINEITSPINNLIFDALGGLRLNQVVNIGTGISLSPIKSPSQNIDFSRFFSSSRVSSNDVTSFLKEAAITGVNLSILIISITTQVLKGLLEAIK